MGLFYPSETPIHFPIRKPEKPHTENLQKPV